MKGLFIPGITEDMFRNASLEGIEALISEGEVYDAELDPEPQWTLCSERMPDKNEDVLLQFKSNMSVGFYENGDWGINTGDGIYSAIGYNEEKPIAWMPLPEPYRKEGD